MERRPNETSEQSYHKYTINFPLYLWYAIQDRTAWGSKYNNKVSPFIIDHMERVCFGVQERPATAQEVIERGKAGQTIYADPPRKYHGFANGLMKNNFT
jgi:hypothetical protein